MPRPRIDWKGGFRRDLIVAARSGKGPLTEPTAYAQRGQRELVCMPLSGRSLPDGATPAKSPIAVNA
jgi:hypothetical protein